MLKRVLIGVVSNKLKCNTQELCVGKKTLLEQGTLAYWTVVKGLREKTSKISSGEAITQCNIGDMLPPQHFKVKGLLHELKFDLIEGSDSWRKNTP